MNQDLHWLLDRARQFIASGALTVDLMGMITGAGEQAGLDWNRHTEPEEAAIRLALARELRAALEGAARSLEEYLVAVARDGYVSWAEIGSLCGVRRQTVQEQYRHVVFTARPLPRACTMRDDHLLALRQELEKQARRQADRFEAPESPVEGPQEPSGGLQEPWEGRESPEPPFDWESALGGI